MPAHEFDSTLQDVYSGPVTPTMHSTCCSYSRARHDSLLWYYCRIKGHVARYCCKRYQGKCCCLHPHKPAQSYRCQEPTSVRLRRSYRNAQNNRSLQFSRSSRHRTSFAISPSLTSSQTCQIHVPRSNVKPVAAVPGGRTAKLALTRDPPNYPKGRSV